MHINGRERALQSGGDMLRALIVRLESAEAPPELARTTHGGFKGWLLRKVYERMDTRGISFEAYLALQRFTEL